MTTNAECDSMSAKDKLMFKILREEQCGPNEPVHEFKTRLALLALSLERVLIPFPEFQPEKKGDVK